MKTFNEAYKNKVLEQIDLEIEFQKDGGSGSEQYIDGLLFIKNAILNPEDNKGFLEYTINKNKDEYKVLEDIRDFIQYATQEIKERNKVSLFCISFNHKNIINSKTIKKLFPDQFLKFKYAYATREQAFNDYDIIIDKLLDVDNRFSLLIEEESFDQEQLKQLLSSEDYNSIINNLSDKGES